MLSFGNAKLGLNMNVLILWMFYFYSNLELKVFALGLENLDCRRICSLLHLIFCYVRQDPNQRFCLLSRHL